MTMTQHQQQMNQSAAPVWFRYGEQQQRNGGEGGQGGGEGGGEGGGQGGEGGQVDGDKRWFMTSELITDDDRAWMQTKGFAEDDPIKSFVKLAKSNRDLEKVFRNREHAVLPPKWDDPEQRKEFFGKFGLPKEATAYELPEALKTGELKDVLDKDLVGEFQGLAFAADVLPYQFQSLVEGYAGLEKKLAQIELDRYNGEVASVNQKLEVEMGDAYAENVARGNLAMDQLGISKDDIGEVNAALGVERATRMFMRLGEMMAQHKGLGLTSDNPPDGFVTDRARAKQRIQDVQLGSTEADKAFLKALQDPMHPRHKDVHAEWTEWLRVANTEPAKRAA